MIRVVVVLVVALVAAGAVVLLPPWTGAVVAGGSVVIAWLIRRPVEAPPPSERPAAGRVDFVLELRRLVALLPEGVLVVDDRETVLVANPAVARILRRPHGTMEAVSLIRATRDAALVQVLREASGEPRDLELGDDRLVRAAATRLDAPPIYAVLTVQDLTALRIAERARSELVGNVSHELRTPIAAARALAETLEAGVDEPEQREHFLNRLTHELERLGEIVERLLRLSRLESNAEEFDIAPIEATELASVAIARMRPVADRAGVRLELHEEITGGGGAVLVDQERALEVLTNLMDNALRYAPEGSAVTIGLGPIGRAVRFSVHDEGPGILPADRQRIFERFYTADRARAGGTGTGLGLAIARHIVSRHGGEIWVADESPGATLCFTMPRADAPA